MTSCKHARHPIGLTLIEMCVVIGICGVLAMLLVPMMLRARSNARAIVCADNLKGLGQAYAIAMSQSSGILPEAYYTFEGNSGTYSVGLKSAEGQWAGGLFAEGVPIVRGKPPEMPEPPLCRRGRHRLRITALQCPAYTIHAVAQQELVR